MYLGSLLGEHVRIMQETTVLVLLCKPRATWNEVGLLLCGRWRSVLKCDVSVLCVRVGVCCFVMLCGGDGLKMKENDFCNFKKMSREGIYLHYGFN